MDCTLSKHTGGFATIDPRHADDTPQSSAYGSNSPQTTNEHKPHHHDKHTKTCRTRPAPHHLRHRQQPHPLKHPQHRPRRPRNTTRRRNHAQTVVHYTPNTPCHPHFTEVDCTLSKHSGGFATIDPRHAGDTPQSSAYGSNSPQATNEHKPHHHDKQTKTCRTQPTQPPKEHAALALPSNHAGGFATIDPRHAGDTPQGSAYGSNSPHRAQASTKPAPSQHQASPKAAHKIFPSDPKHPQATPTRPTPPTHTKGRRGLSRGAPTRLTAGDTCYLMRVQTTT